MVRIRDLETRRTRHCKQMKNPKLSSLSSWAEQEIENHLVQSRIPCRLATITKDGFPHVMSLWYLYQEGCIFCSVQEKTSIVDWLFRNPQCGFEVASDKPPYKGIRGRGSATLEIGKSDNVLPLLINRYLGSCDSALAQKLLARPETEVTIRIIPHWLTSWDFTARMN